MADAAALTAPLVLNPQARNSTIAFAGPVLFTAVPEKGALVPGLRVATDNAEVVKTNVFMASRLRFHHRFRPDGILPMEGVDPCVVRAVAGQADAAGLAYARSIGITTEEIARAGLPARAPWLTFRDGTFWYVGRTQKENDGKGAGFRYAPEEPGVPWSPRPGLYKQWSTRSAARAFALWADADVWGSEALARLFPDAERPTTILQPPFLLRTGEGAAEQFILVTRHPSDALGRLAAAAGFHLVTGWLGDPVGEFIAPDRAAAVTFWRMAKAEGLSRSLAVVGRLKERPAARPPSSGEAGALAGLAALPSLAARGDGFVHRAGGDASPFASDPRGARVGDAWSGACPYRAYALWRLGDASADERLARCFPGRRGPDHVLALPFLTWHGASFVLAGDPGDATLMARATAAGFAFSPGEAVWRAQSLAAARALADLAEPELRDGFAAGDAGGLLSGMAPVALSELFRIHDDGEDGLAGSEGAVVAAAPRARDLTVAEDGAFVCRDRAAGLAAGFTLTADGTVSTRDLEAALRLRHRADDRAEMALQEGVAECIAVAAEAAAASVVVPASPAPYVYTPAQMADIRFCLSRPVAYVGNPPGTGKTVVALGAANALAAGGRRPRVLVTTKAALLWNWLGEARRWLSEGLEPAILSADEARRRGFDPRAADPLAGWAADVTIVSIDSVARIPALAAVPWDLVVHDEAHWLRSAAIRRACAAMGPNAPQARHRILLSGTPVMNRPQDMADLLCELVPEVFASRADFARLYAVEDPRRTTEVQTARLQRLGAILRKAVMVRRRLEDAVAGLPPKTRRLLQLNLPEESLTALIGRQEAILRQLATVPELPEPRSVAIREILGAIERLRRDTALAKVPVCAAHIASEWACGDGPAVVFCYHVDVAVAAAAALGAAGLRVAQIDGSMPPRKRQAIVDAFQDGEYDALVATLQACGEGLTMTQANRGYIIEIDWRGALMAQGEDRLHRMGQLREVTIEYLLACGTIEAYVAEMVEAKLAVSAAALGDGACALLAALRRAEALALLAGPPRADDGTTEPGTPGVPMAAGRQRGADRERARIGGDAWLHPDAGRSAEATRGARRALLAAHRRIPAVERRIALGDLLAAGLIEPGTVIRLAQRVHGFALGSVLANARVAVDGVAGEFDTLSAAGVAVTRNGTINGWRFWTLADEVSGDWIPLEAVRREFANRFPALAALDPAARRGLLAESRGIPAAAEERARGGAAPGSVQVAA